MTFEYGTRPAVTSHPIEMASTDDHVVSCDLPKRIPLIAEEIALLRAFLAKEIDEILRSTAAASSALSSNDSAPIDNDHVDRSPMSIARGGTTPADQCIG